MQLAVDGAQPPQDEFNPNCQGEETHDLGEYAEARLTRKSHNSRAEAEHQMIYQY